MDHASALFVNIDRATPLLLPPNLRDWIPPNHLAHFLLDAVEVIPESAGHINWRGSDSEQYPPPMMLAVLIYGCVTGRLKLARDPSGRPTVTRLRATGAATPI